MASCEPNRLAQGYARSSLRKLWDMKEPPTVIMDFLYSLRRNEKIRFSEDKIKKLIRDEHQFMIDAFHATDIKTRKASCHLFTKSKVDCLEGNFIAKTRMSSGNMRNFDFAELRHSRLYTSRDKVVADNVSQNVVVSWHALCRLIERGATVDNPIRYLSEHQNRIAGFAAMFLALPDRATTNLAIPVKDGLLLAQGILTSDNNLSAGPKTYAEQLAADLNMDRLRICLEANRKQRGSGFFSIDNPRELLRLVTDQVNVTTIQVATFVSNDMLSRRQESVRSQMLDFASEYENDMQWFAEMNLDPDNVTLDLPNLNGLMKFLKLIQSEDWNDALKL